jgi:hypothetical protein
MTHEDRRAFMRKLAKGTVYAAPVVFSMAAPLDLLGQGGSSDKGGGMDMDKDTMTTFVPPPPGNQGVSPGPPGGGG